ncbi:hypothetical protein, partial [Indiicoccus explosivorum]|uniref:hypothetical protein n=1 Tax=Indiicoccus explosivorum TaxID=1917864 RepID=UPI0019D3405B
MQAVWVLGDQRRNLCAFSGIYARSAGFMRVRRDLCAFSGIYARSAEFMRVQRDLWPGASSALRNTAHKGKVKGLDELMMPNRASDVHFFPGGDALVRIFARDFLQEQAGSVMDGRQRLPERQFFLRTPDARRTIMTSSAAPRSNERSAPFPV